MAAYLIGIDGGGSKTEFLLCDLALNEVARHYCGRSNPNDIGIDQANGIITSGISELCAKACVEKSEIAAAFAGIAGVTSAGYTGAMRKSLQNALPNAKTDVLHDGINVLYGAFPDGDGVCVICGTGSSCFVKTGSEITRIGGYGALDMCGNGYEIGRAALAHALRTYDGRETEGFMESLLHERFGDDFLDALEEMLALDKSGIAALAPYVFKAAESGDKNAIGIIEDNIEYIAGLIKRAGDYFKNGYRVALAGGILQNALANDILISKISGRVEIIKSENPPVFGAAARAKQLLTENV